MFAALVNKWIDTQDLVFEISMEDVETLNTWAGEGKLDISKISFNRALSLTDQYNLLSSGAALGNKCGPLVVAKRPLEKSEVENGKIALPGKWTTAHLLFSRFFPQATNKVFIPFHQIEEAVMSGEALAGVIIHENRFTYQAKGLTKITDLGDDWETQTGLPIPLGGIFASTRLPGGLTALVESLIKESILFARNNEDKVMSYVRKYSQEMDETVMKSHIDLYVNEFSLDLGEKGLKAVEMLKKIAL